MISRGCKFSGTNLVDEGLYGWNFTRECFEKRTKAQLSAGGNRCCPLYDGGDDTTKSGSLDNYLFSSTEMMVEKILFNSVIFTNGA